MSVLKNVEFRWAKIAVPAKKYLSEETQWSIDTIVSDEVSRQFLKNKLITKERFTDIEGEEHCYIRFKKDTHYKKSGDEASPIVVVDKYGKDIDPANIGNGSKGNVQYSVREWEYQGRKGKSITLEAVQITKLVKYKQKKAGSEFELVVKDKPLDLSDDGDFV